ncbi:hypothetical protein [Desertivirga xinjiangensis]|uniref:hypothetical protein n=1 Tax=Desertivirga xinjiangensis TaxID=539206 RepID=UPI00210D2AB9|nr:hypothetical protein [Pedobacter xinjiangensis]
MRKKSIELISFSNGLSNSRRLTLVSEIINKTKADVVLFSGHTIGFVNNIEDLKESVRNRRVEAFFELEDINSAKVNNCMYRLSKGKVISMYTNQLFSTSREIEGNYQLADRLLYELEHNRCVEIDGLHFLVLQCGEINILKNYQSDRNRVEFRLADNKDLKRRFDRLLKRVNVILNPIHSPMGNQCKMAKRRFFLSSKNRYYFSTSNTAPDSRNLKAKALQYALFNGKDLNEVDCTIEQDRVSRLYEIVY